MTLCPVNRMNRIGWMGLVLHCNGGARDPRAYTLFQIADIDSGVIRWVNADLITNVLQGEGGHA